MLGLQKSEYPEDVKSLMLVCTQVLLGHYFSNIHGISNVFVYMLGCHYWITLLSILMLKARYSVPQCNWSWLVTRVGSVIKHQNGWRSQCWGHLSVAPNICCPWRHPLCCMVRTGNKVMGAPRGSQSLNCYSSDIRKSRRLSWLWRVYLVTHQSTAALGCWMWCRESQHLLWIKMMLDKPRAQQKNLSFLSLEEICESWGVRPKLAAFYLHFYN